LLLLLLKTPSHKRRWYILYISDNNHNYRSLLLHYVHVTTQGYRGAFLHSCIRILCVCTINVTLCSIGINSLNPKQFGFIRLPFLIRMPTFPTIFGLNTVSINKGQWNWAVWNCICKQTVREHVFLTWLGQELFFSMLEQVSLVSSLKHVIVHCGRPFG